MVISASVASEILDDDVPQAFSHWTYVYTKHDRLVCDLQGVLEKNVFVMTDPAIHTRSGNYLGPTDQGESGQHNFFKTHKCNPLCKALGLN